MYLISEEPQYIAAFATVWQILQGELTAFQSLSSVQFLMRRELNGTTNFQGSNCQTLAYAPVCLLQQL